MSEDQISKSKWNLKMVAGALLAIGLATVPGAFAGSHSKITSAKSANLVSHLAITSGAATRLQVVKQHKRQYLTIAGGDSSQLIVVDVTKPGQARVVEASSVVGANATTQIAESTADAPEILALLNASNAATSTGAHQFTGSARFLADEKRGLIYVLDGEGLWIVKVQNPTVDSTDSITY